MPMLTAPFSTFHRNRSGFTLVEILVAMGIITILMTVLLQVLPGIRASSQLAANLTNLRNLQAANASYASDHDGAYVPVVLFDSKGVDMPWSANPEFKQYAGAPTNVAAWPRKLLSPLATIKDSEGNVRIERAYAINSQGLTETAYNVPNANWGTRTPKISKPGQTIAFGDALDWQINNSGLTHYKGKEEDFKSQGIPYAIAFRYKGKAGFVFYDGHSEALTREELSRKLYLFDYSK